MANKPQRERKAARDKAKRWDQAVSSALNAATEAEVRHWISREGLREIVHTAQEIGLMRLSIVALEAMKVADKQIQIDKLERSNEALNRQIIQERENLYRAQVRIIDLETALGRRRGKKAKVQHPEKRA